MSGEHLYHGGLIYTVQDNAPWAEAMLVQNGEIIAIGSNENVAAQASTNAARVSLEGRTVIPGIHDAHSHLIIAAGRQLGFGLQLDDPKTLDELGEQLSAYWADHADREWIIGGVYNPLIFTPKVLTRAWLDELLPGVPVIIHDYSYHNVMASSAALAAAGITRESIAKPGGVIEKDPDTGELTGRILEMAVATLYYATPQPSKSELVKSLKTAVEICNRFGITSVQEASARLAFLEAAKELDQNNALNANLICHIPWGSPILALCERPEQERVIAERHKYAGKHVHVDAIKVALDGTSMAPIFSHVPLDPETDEPITYNLLLDADELESKVEEWTRDGLIVKAHCTGYGSTRIGLDVYERASHVTGKPGQMHDIAHAHYVSETDRGRFAQLGVVAEMSPAIWHVPAYREALGKAYDFRTLHEHGALITIGTDWALPPTPNLFPALAGLLTHGDESVPLELGIRMMTLNGAIAVGQSDAWGSLAPGKDATFVVLDRNIFEASPEEIAETEVISTVFRGKEVYSHQPA